MLRAWRTTGVVGGELSLLEHSTHAGYVAFQKKLAAFYALSLQQ